MGDSPEKAVEILVAEGVAVIGANCSLTSSEMIGLVGEMRSLTDAPLLFQPNAGQPELADGNAVYRQDPGEFADDLIKMVKAGANAVGGCCGTTPEFTRAIRARLDRM